MSHYIHHVPGRLRVKSPALKHAEVRARHITERLLSTPGVLSAQANPLTGSIVIHYDRDSVEPQSFLHLLREHDVIVDAQVPRATSKVGNALADAIVNQLVGIVVKRSALALVGALI